MQQGNVFNGVVNFYTTNGVIQVINKGITEMKKNCYINNSLITFNNGNGSLKLNGSVDQTLSGTSTYSVSKLTVNKGSGGVILSQPMTIDTTLDLTSGIVTTSSTNIISLKASAASSNANSLSFINGPIKKIGNSAFVFPTGKATSYRPIEISAPSYATDAFTAEYFNAAQTLGSSMDNTVKFIDNCNYWNLTRTTGSSNVLVKLYWDNTGCGLLDSSSAHVMNWNGTKWKDLGSGGITGNRNTGKIVNSSAVITYGNFTLGYNQCFMTAYTLSSSDTAKVRSINGNSPYTYLWSTGSVDSLITGINAGTIYTVTVTDTRGCTATANFQRIFSKITGTGLTSEANNSYYATWGDYDNDGDLDLFHSLFFGATNNTTGNNFLFQNNCNGNLTKVAKIPGDVVTDGLTGSSSRWVDYDGDGDLDLYVGTSFLYENQGNGSFVKVNKTITSLGIYTTPIRDAAFADYSINLSYTYRINKKHTSQ